MGAHRSLGEWGQFATIVPQTLALVLTINRAHTVERGKREAVPIRRCKHRAEATWNAPPMPECPGPNLPPIATKPQSHRAAIIVRTPHPTGTQRGGNGVI